MNRKVIGILIAVIMIAALIFVVTSAMGDDKKDNSSDNTGNNSSTQHNDSHSSNQDSETDSEAIAADKVAIEDFAYTPETITVKKGTTVTWTNQDSVGHTVTMSGEGDGPDSEMLAQGESYSFTFNEIGTFEYFCKPHPNMTAKVVVTE